MVRSVATLVGGGTLKIFTTLNKKISFLGERWMDMEKRLNTWDEWIVAGRKVIQRDPAIATLLEPAIKNMGLAKPVTSKEGGVLHPIVFQIIYRPQEQGVMVVPLLEGELDALNIKNCFLKKKIKETALCHYYHGGTYIIILNSDVVVSEIWKGVELTYACYNMAREVIRMSEDNKYRPNSSILSDAHDMIDALETAVHPLLRKIGGSQYEDFLAFAKSRLERNGYSISVGDVKSDQVVLDDIFGPTLSKYEHDRRMMMYATQYLFESFQERFSPEQALFGKIDFLVKTIKSK